MAKSEADSKPGNLERVGFNQTVRDFDRALALAKLSASQHFLVQQAREESWTKAKIDRSPAPYRFRLNLSALARTFGCDRSLLSHAQQDLADKGIFLRDDDGHCRINKDFAMWVHPKNDEGDEAVPLLTGEQLRFARSAKDLAKASTRPSDKGPDRVENHTPPPCEKPHGDRVENHTPPVWKSTHPDAAPPTPPLMGTPASERDRESEREDPPTPPEGGGAGVPPPASDPILPSDDPRAPNVLTPAERGELDDVASLCEALFPMLDDVRRVAAERRGSYPAWAYRPAVEEMRDEPPSKHTGKYLLGIVRRVAAGGREEARAILARCGRRRGEATPPAGPPPPPAVPAPRGPRPNYQCLGAKGKP